jgi:hypothetical protein
MQFCGCMYIHQIKAIWVFTLLLISSISYTKAENALPVSLQTFLRDIEMRSDTFVISWKKHAVDVRGTLQLPVYFKQEGQVAELRLIPQSPSEARTVMIQLAEHLDYDVIEELMFVEGGYFRCKVRFKDPISSDMMKFTLRIKESEDNSDFRNVDIPLFPFTYTRAFFYVGEDDMYVGEEKRFELLTNVKGNIRIDGEWKSHDGHLDYRVVMDGDKTYMMLVPSEIGGWNFSIQLPLKRPSWDPQTGLISYVTYTPEQQLNIRNSRLTFLKFDQKELIRKEGVKEGFEVQIDNHRNLAINKTYRIEDREEKGGALIAELFTVRRLSNDKVIGILRPYDFHRFSDGYLFIKDGDQAVYLTNINILPEAKISKVMTFRAGGGSWSPQVTVYPGEVIDVKLEGEGLETGNFYFEDLEDVSPDTLTKNDRVANFRIKVPLNIRKSSLMIYNDKKPTGFSLLVKEHLIPREFDFVYLHYGDGEIAVNSINTPIFYDHTIKNIVFSFDHDKIDQGTFLHGKQFLELEVRFLGPKDELLEMHTLDYIEICPGESSPRFTYYQSNSCNRSDISINELFSRKTHDLPVWSKIEITLRHKKGVYQKDGFSKKMQILLQKRSTFDVDLSFPTGLLIRKVGDTNLPNFGGISLAMIAQVSFYEKDKMRKLRPFKVGAGFLAQNAFNFNPEAERDLALVAIASVYPTTRDRKLSFPIYAGFGFFMYESRFFYLLGPGVRVNF